MPDRPPPKGDFDEVRRAKTPVQASQAALSPEPWHVLEPTSYQSIPGLALASAGIVPRIGHLVKPPRHPPQAAVHPGTGFRARGVGGLDLGDGLAQVPRFSARGGSGAPQTTPERNARGRRKERPRRGWFPARDAEDATHVDGGSRAGWAPRWRRPDARLCSARMPRPRSAARSGATWGSQYRRRPTERR